MQWNTGTGFIIACFIYFIIDCITLGYTSDMAEGVRHVQKTSGLVAIPLALYTSSFLFQPLHYRILWKVFVWTIFAAAFFCILSASTNFISSGSPQSFFYHELAAATGQHAIRFSILVLCAIIFLTQMARENESFKKTDVFLLIFFTIFLVLLSSKFVLLMYFIYLLLLAINWRKNKAQAKFLLFILMALAIFSLIIALTNNPVSQRFRLLFSGDRELFKREQFDPGIYFNGMQFRLLHWRLVPQILEREDRWMTGLSSGDAQAVLNKIYAEKHMYTGIAGTENRGLLDYHTHNQFLQSLLHAGIPGLLSIMLLFGVLFKMALKSGGIATPFLVCFIFLYCFTDAVLETQYGIVIFSFFPFISYLSHRFNLQE